MGYEIEFIGINEDVSDADAICMRWSDISNNYIVGVYDGGFIIHGEALNEHINSFYFRNKKEKIIDFVICSHSDQDHASGLTEILENYEVKALYMNRPWLYITDIFDKVNDGRITKESLERRLREKYQYIAKLEEIALEKNIKIFETFQGKKICEKLEVLSPTKDFYLELLVESDKTPLSEKVSFMENIKSRTLDFVNKIKENWNIESLREDVSTSAENEMSIVVLGKMENENFLLTGDVGIRGLDISLNYAIKIGYSLDESISVYQIPHHGSRHNVSTSILNRLIGKIGYEGYTTNKTAFACVGKTSENPKQMVVNAFIRRGVKVFKTNGHTIRHSQDTLSRDGWNAVENIKFSSEVEEW